MTVFSTKHLSIIWRGLWCWQFRAEWIGRNRTIYLGGVCLVPVAINLWADR